MHALSGIRSNANSDFSIIFQQIRQIHLSHAAFCLSQYTTYNPNFRMKQRLCRKIESKKIRTKEYKIILKIGCYQCFQRDCPTCPGLDQNFSPVPIPFRPEQKNFCPIPSRQKTKSIPSRPFPMRILYLLATSILIRRTDMSKYNTENVMNRKTWEFSEKQSDPMYKLDKYFK